MKICRFTTESIPDVAYGIIEGDHVRLAAFTHLNKDFWVHDPRDNAIEIPLKFVKILEPVEPSKVVCVGRNYREHAAELGNPMPTEPLLFLKAPSSIIGPEETIELPPESKQVEHEGELGVVIGRLARKLRADDDPLQYVVGYTCLNDVTARDLQRKDVQFTRGKSFDTFCPIGPFIETDINPTDLEVTTRVNGEVKQQGRTSQMAFPVPMLIRYISHIMTLYPGDVIATGTPAGVSRLAPGDTVEVEVEGIGTLRNTVSESRES
ncbi:MAG TPA: fumarylacetoacetate hydrolase family protein [Pyrinomonadaceae bacterium]|jgi:2-keto-4-pentenoate hydratase/2-oxohepta-3-ene-1,7-dioic acid hydratase in catechol pathway